MQQAWTLALVALSALPCRGYELTGRIEPAAQLLVSLHGSSLAFENSTTSGADGRFRFRKVPVGTYTLAISTEARGEALQTVDLTPGTVDAAGRLDVLVRIDEGRLESDGIRTSGATVSTTILSVPDRALTEYRNAQQCLSRGDSECATGHLRHAVEIAPRFATAWNHLGTLAYQQQRYSDAETCFRKALEADPEAFEPMVNLGGVLLNLGRPREALDYPPGRCP